MRRGFSLPEIIMVVALFGILAGIALPRVHAMLESIAVEGAARQIGAAHLRARAEAVMGGRVALLDLAPDTLRIRTVSGNDTVVVWRAPGPATDGIVLTGPQRPLVYSPLGLTLGVSNGTWHLAYGGASRDVIVSRLGRLRIR